MEKKDSVRYKLVSAASFLFILAVWYLVTAVLKAVPPKLLPSPLTVLKTFIAKLYQTKPDGATLLQHLAASLQIALGGYLIGISLGIPTGIFMAWNKTADRFIRPLFDLIRPIPGLAWIPVMIILFGIGILSRMMIIVLGAFTASLINAYSGIRQTKAVHLWVGRTFGASNMQLLFRVAIPTSLPMILTGLRVALGGSWSALVAAEMLASSRGLGFMIQQSRGLLRPDIIISGMIAIGVVGAFLTWLLTRLEHVLLKGGRW
ncbi:taurine ABC transporter permease [Spirochaetia bacterium]|nr:taurine ABC transporter permease [Spirochaetia bacterium]